MRYRSALARAWDARLAEDLGSLLLQRGAAAEAARVLESLDWRGPAPRSAAGELNLGNAQAPRARLSARLWEAPEDT